MNNTRAKELAAQFKTKATAARKAIELPVPLVTDPDFTFPCVVRRVDVVAFVTAPNAGLPEQFANQLLGIKPGRIDELKAKAEEVAAEQTQSMTLDDLKAIQDFQRRIAQQTCLEPRIVFEATDDEGAIDLSSPDFAHCANEIVTALYNYGMSMSPDVPVRIAGGAETTLKAVESFREIPKLVDAGNDGAELQPTAI